MKNLSPFFVFLTLFFCSFVSPAFGQDLIARQAPIDRKMKSVDSLTINRIIKKTYHSTPDLDELYTSWNTKKVHCYTDAVLPETYKIDLRGFKMPTPSRIVTSHFGYRPSFRRMHKGLDIKVYTGDTIVSAFDGKVRVVDYEAAGYGYYVVIRHNNGLETIYGHLSKQLVATGDVVKAGDVIGLGGNTGRSFGSHLHFETRFLGVAIDPALLFDFANQDVTGDYFVFNSSDCSRGILAQVEEKVVKDDSEIRLVAANVTTSSVEQPLMPLGKFYQVKRGENLYRIATKIGMSVEELCKLNGLKKSTKLQQGQVLRY